MYSEQLMLVDGWLISGGILDIKIEIFTGVQKPDLSPCYQVILLLLAELRAHINFF
jgi:hypothetical protein